jgi:hypothetical protein
MFLWEENEAKSCLWLSHLSVVLRAEVLDRKPKNRISILVENIKIDGRLILHHLPSEYVNVLTMKSVQLFRPLLRPWE